MLNQSKRKHDDKSSHEHDTITYTKTCIITEKTTVEEALDDFKDEFSKAASHCHVKSIPEWEFQNDLKVDTVRILEIEFAVLPV